MQKSILHLYLSKVAEGNKEYLPKLCQKIAERLVYAPVSNPAKGRQGVARVNVVRIKEENHFLIPLFTNPSLLKKWCKEKGMKSDSISLLCADLCAALERGSWIVIDPGTDISVALDPTHVELIAEAEFHESGNEEVDEALMTEKPTEVEGQQPPAVATEAPTPEPNVDDTVIKYPKQPLNPKDDLTTTSEIYGVAKDLKFKGYLKGEGS